MRVGVFATYFEVARDNVETPSVVNSVDDYHVVLVIEQLINEGLIRQNWSG